VDTAALCDFRTDRYILEKCYLEGKKQKRESSTDTTTKSQSVKTSSNAAKMQQLQGEISQPKRKTCVPCKYS